MQMNKETLCIIIPAYNPTNELLILIEKLHKYNYPIIIVNDGSKKECSYLFDNIQSDFANTVVSFHNQNMGQGAAIKTGFKIWEKEFPDSKGVVTADADGQHITEDIVKIANKLNQDESALILV